MLEYLFTNPFLYSLALTLLHFLWQGLLVALILKSALVIIDKSKSQLRYALSTAAMLCNFLTSVLTFVIIYPRTSTQLQTSESPIPLTTLVNELTLQSSRVNYQELIPTIVSYSLPYLALFWLVAVLLLACKLLIEVYNVNKLPFQESMQPPAELLSRFNALTKQLSIKRLPTLLISMQIKVPMAIGWLKPVVLLPAGMVTGLNPAQLEMLILHELAHIRRHDYLVNFLQTLIELLFFFQPAVHWVGKQMRNEREYCSDDIAVHHCGDPIAYAHTLADTASLCVNRHQATIPNMAMAASGGDLQQRVLRLVDHHCSSRSDVSKWFAGISVIFLMLLISTNQLMTLPFAQQWEHKLSWLQSNNFTRHDTNYQEISEVIPPGKDNNNIASDSIASQLLVAQPLKTPLLNHKKSALPLLEDNNIKSKSTRITYATTSDTVIVTPLKSATYQVKQKALAKKMTVIDVDKRVSKPTDHQYANKTIKSLKIIENKVSNNAIEQPSTTPISSTNALNSTLKVNAKAAIMNKQVDLSLRNDTKQPTSVEAAFNNMVSKQKSSQLVAPYRKKLADLAAEDSNYQATQTQASSQKNESKIPHHADIIKSIHVKEQNVSHRVEAKQLNSISPVYPSLAKRKGIEIEVKVNFTIDKNGQVKNITFAQQSRVSYFKNAIRAALRKWRFLPAKRNNKAIESQMSKIFSFRLQN